MTVDGHFKSFLLKGRIFVGQAKGYASYLPPGVMFEEEPLELIPYFDVGYSHFLNEESKEKPTSSK